MSIPSQAIPNPTDPSSTRPTTNGHEEEQEDGRSDPGVIVEENLGAAEDDPIVVVGGSYAGAHAARTLAKSLPPGTTSRVLLLEQRSHLAHLYVLPRFAVVEGYEEHAFIPYTNIFASEDPPQEVKSDVKKEEGGEKGQHHPNEDLEKLEKEPRAEYIQSTVTRITRSHVSFVRHHPRSSKAAQAKKEEEEEGKKDTLPPLEQEDGREEGERDVSEGMGTLKLGPRKAKKGSSVWKLEEPKSEAGSNEQSSTGMTDGSHIHIVDGREEVATIRPPGEIVQLLTPPPSEPTSTPTSGNKMTFTCCNDCISPSSGCCQASGSSASDSTPDQQVGTGPTGLLTPQPSVEFKIPGGGPHLRGRGCATCLSPSETCCQATGDNSSSPDRDDSAPSFSRRLTMGSRNASTTSISSSTWGEPIAGGVQPRLATQIAKDHYARAKTGQEKRPDDDNEQGTETIRFRYLVYATGSRLPHPLIRLPKKKMEAKDWLKENQRVVREATRVLVVGGGALGIQFASDIKAYFPSTHVILINSRSRFLSIYEPEMHDLIQADLEAIGVEVRHDERVDDLADLERQRDDAARQEGRDGKTGRKMIHTKLRSGAVVESDLQIICTGQKHNHELISQEERSLLSERGSLNVKPSMQLDHPGWNHVFAIGDVANTEAIKAGHTGWYQAGVAAQNIVRMVKDGDEAELEVYKPTKPMIKVSVGKGTAVTQMWDEKGTPKVSRTDDVPEDLQASLMWVAMGADTKDMSL